MSIFKKIPDWAKNKYLLAGSFFIVWMVFFAEKDIHSVYGKRIKLNDLEVSEKHLIKKINETKLEQNQLQTNAETIEKYAREKYLMKKDNEDLFVIKPVENSKKQ